MTQNAFVKQRNKKLADKVVNALKKRHFEAFFVKINRMY